MSDGGGTFIFLRSEGHAGKTKVNIQEQEEASMPKTKFESVIFTAVTAWIMVYIMTLYNTVSATGTFVNATFWIALKGMWLEFVIIFLCAYFLSGPVARHFAFRVVKPGDRPIAIILAIQTFTVVSQVAMASILGVWHGYGFTSQFIPITLLPIAGTSSWRCPCSCSWRAPSPGRCSAVGTEAGKRRSGGRFGKKEPQNKKRKAPGRQTRNDRSGHAGRCLARVRKRSECICSLQSAVSALYLSPKKEGERE